MTDEPRVSGSIEFDSPEEAKAAFDRLANKLMSRESQPTPPLCAQCRHDHINGYTREFSAQCLDLDYDVDGGPGDPCECSVFVPLAAPAPTADRDAELLLGILARSEAALGLAFARMNEAVDALKATQTRAAELREAIRLYRGTDAGKGGAGNG